MKLIPLIDRTGAVRAWADRKSGWICNPIGSVFALTEFDAVFAFSGAQIGWWYGDHIRDRYGRVVLTRSGAKIEGLTTPRPIKNSEAAKNISANRSPTSAVAAAAAANQTARVG